MLYFFWYAIDVSKRKRHRRNNIAAKYQCAIQVWIQTRRPRPVQRNCPHSPRNVCILVFFIISVVYRNFSSQPPGSEAIIILHSHTFVLLQIYLSGAASQSQVVSLSELSTFCARKYPQQSRRREESWSQQRRRLWWRMCLRPPPPAHVSAAHRADLRLLEQQLLGQDLAPVYGAVGT